MRPFPWKIVVKFWTGLQATFIMTMGGLLVIWSFKPTRDLLERWTMIDDSTILACSGVAMLLIFKAVADFQKQLDSMKASPSTILTRGVNDVYRHLGEVVDVISARRFAFSRKKTLDVLGITLFTAWTFVEGRLRDDRFTGWTVRLFITDPDYLRTSVHVDSRWAEQAATNITEIRTFLTEFDGLLTSRQNSVHLITYGSLPVVHGFRLGDGSVVSSTLHWSPSTKLNRPFDFYESFDGTDSSDRAIHHRALFENWLEHAQRIGTEIISSTDTTRRLLVKKPGAALGISAENTAKEHPGGNPPSPPPPPRDQ